ncbi:FkbM family methyltransferase [Aquirufa sp.]|jgi:FkbM family methyltransferase|uniref:FkbM family methyltransferase n=1 Tax=Aquirufa sp. TaxID=2676249 RepID=UPI0037C039BD
MISRIKLITYLIELNEAILFYPKLKRFYKKALPQNPTIFDVGANKGQSADFFLAIRPTAQITSFEPNPSLFQFLTTKYQGVKNMTLVNKGVSNAKQILTFYINKLDLTSSFEPLNPDSKYLAKKAQVMGVKPSEIISESIEIETISLREFIEDKHIKHIDLLKIDTEGHELKCLTGLFPLKTCQIDRIQIENHQDDMYKTLDSFESIQTLLQENGYQVEVTIKHGFGEFYEMIFQKSH